MKGVSFFSWFGIPLPFDERLDLIKGAGFEATGGWLGPEEELVVSGQTESMPARIRGKGLFLDYVHVPDKGCNDIWSDSTSDRDRVRKELTGYLAFCTRHAIPALVMHVTASKGLQPDHYNGKGLQAMRDMVKCAEDGGVRIAVENTQSPQFLDFIFSEISSPFLRFCYDTSHDFLYATKPGALLSKWGHLLSITHMGDNDGEIDRHWLPGKGIIPWDLLKRWFPVDTYDGFINLEVTRKESEQTPYEFLREAYGSALWLKEFLALKVSI